MIVIPLPAIVSSWSGAEKRAVDGSFLAFAERVSRRETQKLKKRG
jgi:hypothetical protein